MGLTSRRKGKTGEQEAVRLLRPLFPECRTKRAGGESATQGRGSDLLGTPGLTVQVKLSGRPRPLAALEQAVACAEPHEIPLALVRQCRRGSSGDWVAVIPADHLMRLLERAGYGRDPAWTAPPAVEQAAPGDPRPG